MRFAHVDNRFHYDYYWCFRRIFSIRGDDSGGRKGFYYSSLLKDVIEPKLWYLAKAQTTPIPLDYEAVQAVAEDDRRDPMEGDWSVFCRSAETIELIDKEILRYYRTLATAEDRTIWDAGPPTNSPLYVATETDAVVASGAMHRDEVVASVSLDSA